MIISFACAKEIQILHKIFWNNHAHSSFQFAFHSGDTNLRIKLTVILISHPIVKVSSHI